MTKLRDPDHHTYILLIPSHPSSPQLLSHYISPEHLIEHDTSFSVPCVHVNMTSNSEDDSPGSYKWFLFLHSKGQYIVSGSDDGSFFIWEKETTNLVRILQGDESIVNCLQPHPSYCFLATSGIDPVVRLWNPRPEVNIFEVHM